MHCVDNDGRIINLVCAFVCCSVAALIFTRRRTHHPAEAMNRSVGLARTRPASEAAEAIAPGALGRGVAFLWKGDVLVKLSNGDLDPDFRHAKDIIFGESGSAPNLVWT